MKRFVEGEDRRQATLLPDCLDDYGTRDNPDRVIEAFIDELDLGAVPEQRTSEGKRRRRPPQQSTFPQRRMPCRSPNMFASRLRGKSLMRPGRNYDAP